MDRIFLSFEYPTEGNRDFGTSEDEQASAKAILDAIVNRLRDRGFDILNSPATWDSYGWSVDVKVGRATLTCMIQRSDEWLLQIFGNRRLFDRLTGTRYDGELRALATAVSAAVNWAFAVPVPKIQNEAEFRQRGT